LLLLLTAINGLVTIKLVLVLIFLLGSALISGAEVALFGFAHVELDEMEEESDSRSKTILSLLERPKRLQAVLMVSNYSLNIGAILLLASMGEQLFPNLDGGQRFLALLLLGGFLVLMVGEILPKILANKYRMRFSRLMARPIWVLDLVLRPLCAPLGRWSQILEDRLGKQKSGLSVDHLSQALELASDGDTTEEEQKILEGIVNFGNTDTKQVMQPRIDIFALNENMKFSQVLEEIIKNDYSRIPVFSENMDNVLGVLYVKDVLPHLDRKTFNWMSLIREPYFVPENKKLDDLLLEFQTKKNHLAVVVDEYGGTSGIVTLEDIIEEIVGDISDEFDDEDLIFSKLDEHTYVFDGKTTLKEFYRVVKLENEELFEAKKGESETLAGFVLEISGSFPKQGEKVNFKGYGFVVESMDKKRLKRIKITLPHDN